MNQTIISRDLERGEVLQIAKASLVLPLCGSAAQQAAPLFGFAVEEEELVDLHQIWAPVFPLASVSHHFPSAMLTPPTAQEPTVICPWTMQRMWICLVGTFEGGGTFIYLSPQLLPLGFVVACSLPSHLIALPLIAIAVAEKRGCRIALPACMCV